MYSRYINLGFILLGGLLLARSSTFFARSSKAIGSIPCMRILYQYLPTSTMKSMNVGKIYHTLKPHTTTTYPPKNQLDIKVTNDIPYIEHMGM